MTSDAAKLTTRLATAEDLGSVCEAFLEMLTELEPLGHDVKATPHNAAFFGTYVFGPCLSENDHGIVVACDEDDRIIGVSFFTPEQTQLEVQSKRAIAHGIWVHLNYRKNGLALKLQEKAHERLSELGYVELVSTVVKENVAGLKSAFKGGAQITGYLTSVAISRKGDE